MKKITLLLLALLTSATAWSHRDRMTKIVRAELEFETGDKVVLTQDRVSIHSLVLVTKDWTASVPSEDLFRIGLPRIGSMEVLWGQFSDPPRMRYKYIRFEFGDDSEKIDGVLPTVEFHFREGKYYRRELTR